MTPPRTAASLRAYALWEQLQGDERDAALAALPALQTQAEQAGWTEVAFVARAAQLADAVVRPGGPPPDHAGLQVAADGAPASLAVALALEALDAGTRGDTETVLAGVGRAVALLDDDGQPPLERCTGYVVAAAACNGLGLWELVDELYGAATDLLPACPAPVQAPALAVNRVLVRLEWATGLLEAGEEQAARVQLARVRQAAEDSRAVALPALWRQDVAACETVAALLLGEDDAALVETAREQREALAAAGDLETLPALDAARALALVRLGRHEQACEVADLQPPTSASTGAASFPAWARAQVLDPGGWQGPVGAYARGVAEQRWRSRGAVLVAARARVALERLRSDHRRLAVDATTDVLTGLSNRRAFEQWLDAPAPRDARAAVLLLDLDAFKAVNDTHGHGVGDDVLRAVGRLIAASVRPGDLACRSGGDEFAVVLTGADVDRDDSVARARGLRQRIVEHDWAALADGLQVHVSLGVAVGPLADGGADVLYRRADRALYDAKHSGDGVALAA